MSIIKKSAIALAVASCFSGVGAIASEQNTIALSLASIEQAMQQKPLAQIAKAHTNIGLKNQIDTQIGQATFQWASGSSANINIKPIRQENRIAYAAQTHLKHLTPNATAFGSKVFISNSHNQNGGAKLAKYKQEISGIEVFNREVNIMMDRDYNLVASSGFFANNTALQALNVSKQPLGQFGEPSKAISSAFKAMGGNVDLVSIREQSADKKYTSFNVKNTSDDFQLVGNPRAKKVFFELDDELISAHYIEIETADPNTVESEYHAYVIAAGNGKVLFKKDMRSHAGDYHYRVHAGTEGINKPEQGPFGQVSPLTGDVRDFVSTRVNAPLVSLTSGPISTNDAWLPEGATTTSGNNVKSYVDAVAPNGFTAGDFYADTTSDNTFDYIYDQNSPEYSKNNRKAAIVNLFYVNNYLHDQFYDHGFDELSGNAQLSNFDRGGVEGDPLLVEVQDNSGFNNANMLTPADGASPVMQMYLFNDVDAVNGQDYGITSISGSDFEFNTATVWNFGSERFDVKGTLTPYLDEETGGFANTCESLSNSENLQGNIAVVQYSIDCPLSEQIGSLKYAGAIGSIVVVPFGGDRVFSGIGLRDDDPAKSDLSFPVMNISQNEASDLFANWKNDIEVRFFDERKFRDSSWDNGIVAHEWGHYISNRLVGNGSGLRNHQGRSLGEGWGDFHALMLFANEKDAQIAGNETFQFPYEISSYAKLFRKVPYTPNMTLNGLTFKDIQRADGTAQVHDAGTLWATTLWDAYVSLINEHTFKEAESRMMDYLVAGYKMTPINPTYTEARDAILAAAAASDQNDFKLMLKAFARRGMGLDAVSPARFSDDHSGVVESFEADTNPVSLKVMSHNLNTNYEGLTSGYCSNDNILDSGETGTVSFKVMNTNPEKPLTNIKAKIEVLSDHDVTFENDGIITFDTLDAYVQVESPTLEFKLNDVENTRDLLSLKLSFIDLDLDEDTKASLSDASEIHELVNFSYGEQDVIDNAASGFISPRDFSINTLIGGSKVTDSATYYSDGIKITPWQTIASEADVAYESKPITVGFNGNFSLSWTHLYDLSQGHHGGVVEISVNDTEWTDISNIGSFSTLGYSDTVTHGELSGREAFTGHSEIIDRRYQFTTETVHFGDQLDGSEVKIRFRSAFSGQVNNNNLGWIITDVQLTNVNNNPFSAIVAHDAQNCDNRLPSVTHSENKDVNEGEAVELSVEAHDPNGDALTYTWSQTSGSVVTLTDADKTKMSFTAPSVNANEVLEFSVSVNDGMDSVVSTIKVNVANVPDPVVKKQPKKSSSSGTFAWLALLAMPLAILRRRKQK
jgi:hypothetical protein